MIKWNAEHYRNNSLNQEKWAGEFLSKLGLKGDERLLDIGCGDGRITAEISRLLPEGSVVGIDSSPEMIRFSKRNFPGANFPNLVFLLMDMRKIDFAAEFDAVYSTATLHWVTDHLEVLKQIKKCLRNNGKVFLQMGGSGNQEELVGKINELAKREKWQEYFQGFEFRYGYYGPGEYAGWLQEAGLHKVRLELIDKDNLQNGKEGLCEWIRLAFSPFVQRIPPEKQSGFVDDAAEDFIKDNPPDANGYYHIKMVRLEVEAHA